jgi:hypothetical protein
MTTQQEQNNQPRYFIDDNGTIWTVFAGGISNFPRDITVAENVVQILGEKEDDSPGRPVENEFTLWPSLMALALAIEYNEPTSDDGSVSLKQAVGEMHAQIQSFELSWIDSNRISPVAFPLALPADNAGLWFEQMLEHNEE